MGSRLGFCLFLAVSLPATADETPTPSDRTVQERLADIEQRIDELKREVQELRAQLPPEIAGKRRALTPIEAVESFRKNPQQPVTVEFGVLPGSADELSGLQHLDEPVGPIRAVWDNYLPEGRTFTAPVFAGGKVYARNTKGDVVSVDMRGK